VFSYRKLACYLLDPDWDIERVGYKYHDLDTFVMGFQQKTIDEDSEGDGVRRGDVLGEDD